MCARVLFHTVQPSTHRRRRRSEAKDGGKRNGFKTKKSSNKAKAKRKKPTKLNEKNRKYWQQKIRFWGGERKKDQEEKGKGKEKGR